ncbi:MAG: outer membrane beta-barrel protein [Fluviicola sp.]
MKRLFLYPLLICHFTSFSQDINKIATKESEKDFPKFQFGVNFSPDACFRILKVNSYNSGVDFIMDFRNENEILKFGYSTGLNFRYNLNSRFGFELGINYATKGYQSKLYQSYYLNQGVFTPVDVKYIDVLNYIDIPFRASYSFGKKRMRYIASCGFMTSLYINAKEVIIVKNPDNPTKKEFETQYDYEKINLSPIVSFGVDYSINKSMNIKVEPTFRYGLIKIIDAPITAYLFSGGVNVSYYITF